VVHFCRLSKEILQTQQCTIEKSPSANKTLFCMFLTSIFLIFEEKHHGMAVAATDENNLLLAR